MLERVRFTVVVLIVLLPVTTVGQALADHCTGTTPFEMIGSVYCGRDSSSTGVCLPDPADRSIIYCGYAAEGRTSEITETYLYASRHSSFVQIWGTNDTYRADAEWCCLYEDVSKIIIRMNDLDNEVWFQGVASAPGGSVHLDIPTKVSLLGGNDFFNGGHATDEVYGGPGDDYLNGVDGDDEIHGGSGDDEIIGNPGNDIIFGGDGADHIQGNRGDDLILGGRGDDTVIGGVGNDEIHGGPGDDTLRGSEDDDRLFGGSGRDFLSGGPGQDLLCGGRGRDRLWGRDNPDMLFGGPGRDWADGGPGVDTCSAETEADCELDLDPAEILGVCKPSDVEDVILE